MGGSGGSLGADLDRALSTIGTLEAAVRAANEEAAALRTAIAEHRFGTQAMCSVPDAARLMGIGERTLRRMIADDEIESTKIGARRLIPRQVIDEYSKAKSGAAA